MQRLANIQPFRIQKHTTTFHLNNGDCWLVYIEGLYRNKHKIFSESGMAFEMSDADADRICPVQVFQWYRTETDVPAIDMANATSAGTGSTVKEERKDYTDKSDPIREHDCIWCMACVSVCPTQAIKVDQSNLEFHEKAVQ